MALTIGQIKDLGFKPAKRGGGLSKHRKYDTLVYTLNKTDFLYIGYNQYSKSINNKTIWKSFKHPETNDRITYKVIDIGDTSYTELKDYLDRCDIREIQLKDYADCPVLPKMESNRDGVSVTEAIENMASRFEISLEDMPKDNGESN